PETVRKRRCSSCARFRFLFPTFPRSAYGGGMVGRLPHFQRFTSCCLIAMSLEQRKKERFHGTSERQGGYRRWRRLDRSRLEQREGDGSVVRARGRKGFRGRPRSRRGAGDANDRCGRGR